MQEFIKRSDGPKQKVLSVVTPNGSQISVSWFEAPTNSENDQLVVTYSAYNGDTFTIQDARTSEQLVIDGVGRSNLAQQ